jgi:xylulose-5-phosphate/fructose-6-phosphate phosphoketolase
LLSVTDHCLRGRNYINVFVTGKQPAPQRLDMDAAVKHCAAGIGIRPWRATILAVNRMGMACAGDVPTLEALAAVQILREHFPELRVRVINVVDWMALQPQTEHPHGISDHDF